MEQISIDKKTKILFIIFFISLAVSVYLTYDRTMVKKDFYVIESNPTTEE